MFPIHILCYLQHFTDTISIDIFDTFAQSFPRMRNGRWMKINEDEKMQARDSRYYTCEISNESHTRSLMCGHTSPSHALEQVLASKTTSVLQHSHPQSSYAGRPGQKVIGNRRNQSNASEIVSAQCVWYFLQLRGYTTPQTYCEKITIMGNDC